VHGARSSSAFARLVGDSTEKSEPPMIGCASVLAI
jgi:hypothetical protein